MHVGKIFGGKKGISHFKSTKGKVMRNVLHVLCQRQSFSVPFDMQAYCYQSLSRSRSFSSRLGIFIFVVFDVFGAQYVGSLFFFLSFSSRSLLVLLFPFGSFTFFECSFGLFHIKMNLMCLCSMNGPDECLSKSSTNKKSRLEDNAQQRKPFFKFNSVVFFLLDFRWPCIHSSKCIEKRRMKRLSTG